MRASDFVVSKSGPLSGEAAVSASKNAVLPMMAACLLTGEEVVLKGTPALTDVEMLSRLLMGFGASVRWDSGALVVKCGGERTPGIGALTSAGRLRASVLALGPLLAVRGRAKLPFPGGCSIGLRPIDLHLKGLRALGAKIDVGEGCIDARCRELVGADVYLDYPSVGATENIMCAATLARGVTTIENPAAEPEIADLAAFLNAMGARVFGAGTGRIRIEGVKALHGCEYSPIPDRIEAGTLMAACAAAGGRIRLTRCLPEHLAPVSAKLREMGAEVAEEPSAIVVSAAKALKRFDISSSPYPGFPTDLQAQFSALACAAKGTSVVTENVFESRFSHMAELMRLGADIRTEGRSAIITGGRRLRGAAVSATDLRAGAALIIAGLIADGETIVSGSEYIDRGYERIEEKLRALGAEVTRTER